MYERELAVAIKAVRQACQVTDKLFSRLHDQIKVSSASNASSATSTMKEDKSPVTVADFCAQAVISHHLHLAFPQDLIVGEEDSSLLKDSESVLVKDILQSLSESLPGLSHGWLLELINKCSYDPLANSDKKKSRFWTVDPVDGTKGFIRPGGEGQYAVCLALINADGQVSVAVLGCPNLSLTNGDRGLLFAAQLGQQSFREPLFQSDGEIKRSPVSVNKAFQLDQIKFCESFEEKHSDHQLANEIRSQLGIVPGNGSEPVRLDSQCKYGMVASGYADCYIRLPLLQRQTGKKYVEKIWDHAAGDLLVRQAGGVVTDMLGRPLDYSYGRLLQGNCGVLASANRQVHDKIVDIYSKLSTNSNKI